MPRLCSYITCLPRHSTKINGCKMHQLPSDHFKCRVWLKAGGFQGTPRKTSGNVYICSCHFVGGRGPTKENPNPIACDSPRNSAKKRLPRNVPPSPLCPTQEQPQQQPQQQGVVVWVQDNTSDTDVTSTQGMQRKTLSTVPEEDESCSNYSYRSTDTIPIDSIFATRKTLSADVQFSASSSNEFLQGKSSSLAHDLSMSSKTKSPFTSVDYGVHKKWRGHKNNISVGTPLQSEQNEERNSDAMKENAHFNDVATQCDTKLSRCYEVQVRIPILSLRASHGWKEEEFRYYTGLSREAFKVLFDLLGGEELEHVKYRPNTATPKGELYSSHSNEEKLFLTLARLRRGYSLRDMEKMCELHYTSVSNIFSTWVSIMANKFKSMEEAIFVPLTAEEENKPDCYKPFPNLRCVIDTTHVKMQKPVNMSQQTNTYSTYKSGNVVKFLVASSLYGGISFVSNGMEGNISDRKIFLQSGMMKFLNPGESVMADRGFDIEADLNEIEVDLLIPPFLGKRAAFTQREVLLAKSIATSRIHVETVIGRIKHFKFLRQGVPNTYLDEVSDCFRVCANLVNFSDPFIKWRTNKSGKKSKNNWNITL